MQIKWPYAKGCNNYYLIIYYVGSFVWISCFCCHFIGSRSFIWGLNASNPIRKYVVWDISIQLLDQGGCLVGVQYASWKVQYVDFGIQRDSYVDCLYIVRFTSVQIMTWETNHMSFSSTIISVKGSMAPKNIGSGSNDHYLWFIPLCVRLHVEQHLLHPQQKLSTQLGNLEMPKSNGDSGILMEDKRGKLAGFD